VIWSEIDCVRIDAACVIPARKLAGAAIAAASNSRLIVMPPDVTATVDPGTNELVAAIAGLSDSYPIWKCRYFKSRLGAGAEKQYFDGQQPASRVPISKRWHDALKNRVLATPVRLTPFSGWNAAVSGCRKFNSSRFLLQHAELSLDYHIHLMIFHLFFPLAAKAPSPSASAGPSAIKFN
jgi:hypothetical protein